MALRVLSVVLLAMFASACGGDEPAATEQTELEPLSVTQWTGKSELFAEYPPLVVGQTSRFAIHLTDISNFKPVTSGQVEVRLEGGGAAPETFRVDAPSRPGIFGVDVKPARAGARELVIALKSASLTDTHRVPDVTVYPDQQAARKAVEAAPAEAEGISFLKEQQWALDFGTVLAEERAIRESIRVPAEIVARPGGAAQVVAPVDGRLMQVAPRRRPAVRSRRDRSSRDCCRRRRCRASCRSSNRRAPKRRPSVDLAVRDRERAERLVAAGASPQKRLDEARAVEAQALARRRAAEAQIAQYNAARAVAPAPAARAGSSSSARRLRARSHRVRRRPARMWLPEPRSSRWPMCPRCTSRVAFPKRRPRRRCRTTAAEIEVAGREAVPIPGRATTLGKVLDPETRTLPIVFAFDNRTLRLPLGQSVFLRLLMEETAPKTVIPVSARRSTTPDGPSCSSRRAANRSSGGPSRSACGRPRSFRCSKA